MQRPGPQYPRARVRLAALALLGGALASLAWQSTPGQTDEALQRWGEATGRSLVKFLPEATLSGLTVDPAPLFSAFANETYEYKGAQSMVRKYPSYVAHRTWHFNDPALDRQQADFEHERKAKEAAYPRELEDFRRTHTAERQAAEQAYQAGHDQAQQQLAALAKQMQDLANQGKYEEMAKLGQRVGAPSPQLAPFMYLPEKALIDAQRKEQEDYAERAGALAGRHRSVNFAIYANRTPTATAPKYHPKPAGTLAGRALWRQDEGQLTPGHSYVDLAVGLGPPDFNMPQVLISHKELAIRTIVVWAFIESRPETLEADEAAARKILASMNYEGLAALIEP